MFNLSPTHCESHNCILCMHAVFGLIIYYRLWSIDNSVSHFDAPVSRKTMHVNSVLFGQGHATLIADPMFILTDGINELCRVIYRYQRSPALGIHDIGTNERFIHIMDNLKATTRFTRVAGSSVQDRWHQFELRGMSKHDIRAELREEFNNRLGQRERLGIRFGIGT